MKKINFIYCLLVFTTFLSCEKMLEEEPEYSLNEQTLFSTQESAQLALNACYGWVSHNQVYGQGMLAVTESASGIGWARKNPGNSESNFAAFDYLADGFYGTYLWNGLYKAIAECNIFIAAAEKSDLENKYHLIAQAKFLRGLCYYNLGYIWGGVPLKLAAPTAETTDLARSTKQEVIDQVITDFMDAELDLNDSEPDSSTPSKLTANTMLSKVYFLLASAEGAGSPHWATAKQFGDEVFAVVGNTPPLEADFRTLFNENTRESAESLFTLVYSGQATGRSFNKNCWMQSPYHSTVGGKHWPNRRVSKAFFNYFNTEHPGDPRIDASYFHTGYLDKWNTVRNAYPGVKNGPYSLPFFKKHHDSRVVGSFSNKNFFVLRYADLLLLMADVENELGNTASAVGYVNQVLARARQSVDGAPSMEPADVNGGISQEDLRQIIFDERLFELSNEGHSFMETRRRGTSFLSAITQRHNAEPDAIPGFDSPNPWTSHRLPESGAVLEKSFLLPIPQPEINTNKGISQEDQNPGY